MHVRRWQCDFCDCLHRAISVINRDKISSAHRIRKQLTTVGETSSQLCECLLSQPLKMCLSFFTSIFIWAEVELSVISVLFPHGCLCQPWSNYCIVKLSAGNQVLLPLVNVDLWGLQSNWWGMIVWLWSWNSVTGVAGWQCTQTIARVGRPMVRDNDIITGEDFTWELAESGQAEKRKAREGSRRYQINSSCNVGFLIPTLRFHHMDENKGSRKKEKLISLWNAGCFWHVYANPHSVQMFSFDPNMEVAFSLIKEKSSPRLNWFHLIWMD